MVYRVAVVALLNLVFMSAGFAASCNVGSPQKTVRPEWVNNPAGAEVDGRVYGTGIAEISGSEVAKAVAEARSQANANLVQSISVNVSSTIKSVESKMTQDGKTAVRSSFEALSESVSNLTLKSVAVDGQWIDGVECRVWVRVAMSRAEADRALAVALSARLVTTFETQIKIVENAALAVAERERALAAAAEILKQVDASLVPEFSMDAAHIRVEAVQPVVAEARRVATSYREIMLSHMKAFAQLNAATAPAARRLAATSALTGLQSLVALAPQGLAGLPLPFDANERAAALFSELGTPCMAQQWFAERSKPVPANVKAATQSCGIAEMARERRQMYFAGRSFLLTCTLVLDGISKPWEKVCASVQEKLTRDGAVFVTSAPAQNPEGVHRVTISADGSLRKRVDAESQNTLFRFEGAIASSLKGPNHLDIQDKFEAISGWNPVSAAMTTDVLALNVAARLDAAINRNWEK